MAAGHYEVVVANRNSSYFGSADRLRALGVTTLHWDRRRTPMVEAKELTAYLAAHPRLRGVVDFSCYDGVAAHDAAAHLAAMHRSTGLRVGWYIYISSDSVYEVCAPKADPGSPTTEGRDDRRPEGATARAALNAGDPYGHGKLEAEEVLAGWQPRSTWSYAFLRVPDVVGPRDTSYRWWLYQLLIKVLRHVYGTTGYTVDWDMHHHPKTWFQPLSILCLLVHDSFLHSLLPIPPPSSPAPEPHRGAHPLRCRRPRWPPPEPCLLGRHRPGRGAHPPLSSCPKQPPAEPCGEFGLH